MLSASDANQLTVMLALATLLFMIASALPQRVATTLLLILIPFQAIETRFGSSSMVLAYVVFGALLLRREPVRLPLLPHFLFLLLWYLICTSLMHPSTYVQHGVYIYTLVSAIFVFWICYDLGNRVSLSSAVNAFVVMNVGVAVYCAVQLWLGPGESYNLFGLDYIHMNRVREDRRLTGPFQSSEITAQYLVIMMFVVLHQIRYTANGWWKRGLIALALANSALIIATGSRGELLLLIGGFGVYLWLFRHRLGFARTVGLATSGALALVVTALVVVSFTEFDDLFARLAETDFNEQGIPDTRQALWPPAWREIVKNPILGHGPRLRFFMEEQGERYAEHVFIPFPHSLYLYLLFTVGVPGLILFMWIFWTVTFRCWRAMNAPQQSENADYAIDFARTGVILVMVFVLDGIKMEQMRYALADFWHFWFGLCGLLIVACDHVEKRAAVHAYSKRNGETRKTQLVPAFGCGMPSGSGAMKKTEK